MEINLIGLLLETSYGITGFAIAQALAYLYVIERKEIRSQILLKKTLVLKAIVGFHTLYVIGALACHVVIQWILSVEGLTPPNTILDQYRVTFFLIACGQSVVILSFGGFAYFITKELKSHDA